jgi:hypothetical protein
MASCFCAGQVLAVGGWWSSCLRCDSSSTGRHGAPLQAARPVSGRKPRCIPNVAGRAAMAGGRRRGRLGLEFVQKAFASRCYMREPPALGQERGVFLKGLWGLRNAASPPLARPPTRARLRTAAAGPPALAPALAAGRHRDAARRGEARLESRPGVSSVRCVPQLLEAGVR